MHSMASETNPLPAASSNLQAMSCTRHATPEIPVPLLPAPPIIPATSVPCPESSIGLLEPVRALAFWMNCRSGSTLPTRIAALASSQSNTISQSGFLQLASTL
jgi:hypothetical protein